MNGGKRVIYTERFQKFYTGKYYIFIVFSLISLFLAAVIITAHHMSPD